MSNEEKSLLVSEVNLLRELKHPNIVRYHDRIIDKVATKIFIVMEYCEGGDLAAYILSRRKARYSYSFFFLSLVGSNNEVLRLVRLLTFQ